MYSCQRLNMTIMNLLDEVRIGNENAIEGQSAECVGFTPLHGLAGTGKGRNVPLLRLVPAEL
jgi:hypothetical protein